MTITVPTDTAASNQPDDSGPVPGRPAGYRGRHRPPGLVRRLLAALAGRGEL